MSHTGRNAARPAIRLLPFILSYLLFVSLLTPFAVPRVNAAAGATKKITARGRQNGQSAARREGELIIRFRADTSEDEKTSVALLRGAHRGRKLRGATQLEKLTVPPGLDLEAMAAVLRTQPQVEFAEPNYLVKSSQLVPDDPRFAEQWALKNTGQTGGAVEADINVTPVWSQTTGAPSTIIAIIDSGIDFSHPDLRNNQWTNTAEQGGNGQDDDRDGFVDDVHGWDWITDTGAIHDEQGHGTAMAGLLAAASNNGVGISGVMWRASVMSLRVLDNTGTGDVAGAVEAIDYAVSKGAAVISCSWGTEAESAALRDAIARAGQQGVVVVTSAGNLGRDIEATPYYPASYDLPNLITVTASDKFDSLADFSDWSAMRVAVAAPGVDILTTRMGGDYWTISGTSAAAPLVAGIAGLIKTQRPTITPTAIRQAIIDGARRVAALNGKVTSGGVANAAGALAALPGPYQQSGNNGNSDDYNKHGDYKGHGGQKGPPQRATPPHGSGGQGRGGSFDVKPPPTKRGPAANLPNLDAIGEQSSYTPSSSQTARPSTISANVAPICDTCNEAGGDPRYVSDPEFSNARAKPQNKTGRTNADGSGTDESLGSRNVNWGLPLVDLPGRSGLDVELALYYNSLVWTQEDSAIQYNADNGFPSPGFHLGFPTVQERFTDSQTGQSAYMMVTESGGRVELRYTGQSSDGYSMYEAADNSYTQLIDYVSWALVRMTDGTQYVFSNIANGEKRCTQIKDRNGNYLTITYTGAGRPDTIIDTLGRVLTFTYDANGNLTTLSQPRTGMSTTLVSFSYGQLLVQPNFPGLTVFGPNGINDPNRPNTYISVLTQVTFADGSHYNFEYTPLGQVWVIRHYAPDNHQLSYVGYNLPGSAWLANSAQTDCPRFSERHEWMQWGVMNADAEVVTQFSAAADGSSSQETLPDGSVYKEFYFTAGWRAGLPSQTESWANEGGTLVRKKWMTIAWTQDNTGLLYTKNPRPTEVNVYDDQGNRLRTTMEYLSGFSLPTHVREYTGADGQAFQRLTVTNYKTDAVYIDRRIIGLPYERVVYDGPSGHVMSRSIYHYDWGNPYFSAQAPSTQYADPGYIVGRGNLVAVRRYNCASDAAAYDDNQAMWVQLNGYNMAGSVVWDQDGAGHRTNISLVDSFSDGNNARNTLAYVTAVINADGYTSTTQYKFETGDETLNSRPSSGTLAANNVTYETQTLTYDAVGRLNQLTLQSTGVHVRYVYPVSMNYLQTYTNVQDTATEVRSETHFDGVGKVRAVSTQFSGSVGGFRAVHHMYDVMGRRVQTSNPTEIDANWVTTGDDAAGWVWTTQAYDWEGRPTLKTNPDGSTQELTYGGCGCAGGSVTTARDERGRRRRLTKDALGRLWKVEELDWNQNVYSTATYSYDSLDQLTQISQAGQTRTFEHDGHGRIWRRTTPEQGATTVSYNSDDTVAQVTDARGATQTFGYTGRHLMASITYGVPNGVAATPNVSFAYDAAGNRTQMNDGLGNVAYNYDALSRLTSETRYFSELGASYTTTYGYNASSQLTSVTNPWGSQVGYPRDFAGQVTGVTGAGPVSFSRYVENVAYRAFGGIKQVTYSNSRQLSVAYDNRMRVTRWNVSNVLGFAYSYQSNFFQEKTGRVIYAQSLYDSSLDRSYEYDHVGRLVIAHAGAEARAHIGIPPGSPWGTMDGPYSIGYDYDVYGNMTRRYGWGGVLGGAAGQNSDQRATFTNNKRDGFGYDAAGNLTFDGGQTFTYDATGQQVTASYSGYLLQQGYDGDTLRVKKVENGDTTYYLRSSVLGGRVIAEIKYFGSGGWGWNRGFIYDGGGQLLALQIGGTVRWVHQDPVTKSQRITDTIGAVAGGVDLDPWGGETSRSWNNAVQPRKFTTYERDSNQSDEAMMRRYNRWHSRFDQPDPADESYDYTDPQSFNRYTYARNDPVNAVDPTGLYWTLGSCHTVIVRDAEGLHPTNAEMCELVWVDDGPFRANPPGGGAPTPTAPPNKKICDALAKKIDELMNRDKHGEGGGGTHGLRHRFSEQINGRFGPGTTGWNTHEQAIKNQQTGLRNLIDQWKDNGCGPPPKDAWKWATKPVPNAKQWHAAHRPRTPRNATSRDTSTPPSPSVGERPGYVIPVVIGILVVATCIACPECCLPAVFALP